MFIYRRQIEELVRYRDNDHPMISLYLNVKPPRDFSAELNSLLHNTRREIAKKEQYDTPTFDRLDRAFELIQKRVRYDLQGLKNTRMVAIFTSTGDFWQEYHLPVGLPSRLVVDPKPFVRPLSTLLDEFERFLVLVADSRHARIFSLYLGNFEEHPDLFMETEEVPDRVNVNLAMTAGGGAYSAIGVRGGTGDDQVASHVEDHIHKHMKSVAQRTFDFFKEKRFSHLIIGTPDDKMRPMLKDHLHSYLRQRLAGEFNAQPNNRDDDLRQMALGLAEEYEREHENAIIDRLIDKSSTEGGLGVIGIDPVIRALRMRQVHTLIIRNGFQAEGYLCPRDHILSSREKQCPLCGDEMTRVNDLAEEMVDAAILQDAEVEHVFKEHEAFDKYNTGAILRFTLA